MFQGETYRTGNIMTSEYGRLSNFGLKIEEEDITALYLRFAHAFTVTETPIRDNGVTSAVPSTRGHVPYYQLSASNKVVQHTDITYTLTTAFRFRIILFCIAINDFNFFLTLLCKYIIF